MKSDHSREVQSDTRFEFGKNWNRFLRRLNDQRIAKAEDSLRDFLQVRNLKGLSFLDLGSGSGLFSLAARRLGARVYSVDYDPDSVACTRYLKDRFYQNDDQWTVSEGSALDREFLKRLGSFDIVLSWGVLHHTGSMWEAISNAADCVAAKGRFFVSIYNDQGATSKRWLQIKQIYNKSPSALRFFVLAPCLVRLWGPTTIRDFFRLRPFASWLAYSSQRGMSPWEDVVDWVGGYPFEVAKPEEIIDAVYKKGFTLERLKTRGGLGCNEFLFRKISKSVQQ
jgi:2-polyprenyl-6-hydroxyphenyl methylase/3-demethylubiquinone-9 3-methyltransferase